MMIHINERLRELSGWQRFVEKFLPERYLAEDIGDFNVNRKNIIPTERILPVGCFMRGIALVGILNPVRYSRSSDSNYAFLHDPSGSLRFNPNGNRTFDCLENGTELHKPLFVYDPRSDKIDLVVFDRVGGVSPDRDFEEFNGLKLATCLH